MKQKSLETKKLLKQTRSLLLNIFLHSLIFLGCFFVIFGISIPMINDKNSINLVFGVITGLISILLGIYTCVDCIMYLKDKEDTKIEENNTL